MNRVRVIALTALLTALLAACYRPPGQPAGLSGPSAAEAGKTPPTGVTRVVVGVYSDPATSCCWLARDASFETTIPANAGDLTLTVYTPSDIPKLRRSRQRVTVKVEKQTRTFANVPLGTQQLQLAVRPARSARTALVTMHMDVTFTPREELGTADTRTLSIYLKSVRAW